MALDWRTRKAPKIGLRVQKLPYGHLHEHYGRDFDAEREKAEIDIYQPPLSDSDEQSPTPPRSPKPKSESPPPLKRRRRDTRSSQQTNLTTPPSVKEKGDSADIPRTTFTSTEWSSGRCSGSIENKAPFSSLDSRAIVKDDSEDLFAEWNASQSKPTNTYRGPMNIHKAAPVKPEKKRETMKQEKTESMVKRQPDGFMVPDTEALLALGMGLLCSFHQCMLILHKSHRLKMRVQRPISSNQLDHRKAQDRRGQEDVQQKKNRTV